MDEYRNKILDYFNLILGINVNSLYTGEYCYKDTNLLENSEIIKDLYIECEEKLYDLNIEQYENKYDVEYLSFVDILDRCLEFFRYLDDITQNKYSFMEQFNNFVTNGTLNLNYNGGSTWTNKEMSDEHSSVDIAIENNFGDVFKIIHEFFHLNNIDKLNYSSNTRSFSEFISLYFENLAMKYFSNDENVLPFYVFFNVSNFINGENGYDELDFLSTYDKYGKIDSNYFELKGMSKYTSEYLDKVGEFLNNNNNFIFDVINGYPYVLGALLSNYLIYSDSFNEKVVTDKVLDLYYNVDDKSFCDILNDFGLLIDNEININGISESYDNLNSFLGHLDSNKKRK